MSLLSAIPFIGKALTNWQEGRAAQETNRHAQEMATLNQFASEFGHGRTWWDSLIDGINRLPRPGIVLLIIAYIVTSWRNPDQFAVINAGLATIPEEMWYLIGIVVTFFFGARELQLSRKGKGFAVAAEAAAQIASKQKGASEWLCETFPDVQLKAGVVIDGLDIEVMRPVITAVRDACRVRGVPCVITAGLDGKHKKGSKHYKGRALDFRTRQLDDPQAFTVEIRTKLGDAYDVVLESTHLHIEYDPKTLTFFDQYEGG